MRSIRTRGVAPIMVLAAVSVAVLISAAGMQAGKRVQAEKPAPPQEIPEPARPRTYVEVDDADGDGVPDWQEELSQAGIEIATSSAIVSSSSTATYDPVENMGLGLAQTLIGNYVALKQNNEYTDEKGEMIAGTVASAFKAPITFVPHTENELNIDSSPADLKRILAYRADMREATLPLITNDEPELTYYARYIDTKDSYWLSKLTESARRYTQAREAALQVVTPQEAATYHLRAVNAMGVYAETLERLVRFSNDPLASLALLRTYNEAEREVLSAFNALANFYARAAE